MLMAKRERTVVEVSVVMARIVLLMMAKYGESSTGTIILPASVSPH
jgi:hypothetical protein